MISFIVLNWESKGFLSRCIESLRSQDSNDWELIAVDSGSTNGSLELLRKAHREGVVRELIELGENLGFAAGMNAGIRRAKGDIIVPLNSDVYLAPDFVREVQLAAASCRASGRRIGTIAVPVYVWRWQDDGRVDELTDDLFTVGVSLVRRLTVGTWHPGIDAREMLFGPEGSAVVLMRDAVDAASSVAHAVFDESYGSFGEEIDLYARLHSLGYACLPCLRTRIWHVGSASTGGKLSYRAKPLRFQLMSQENRLRNYARLDRPFKAMTVLPWLLLDDLFRLVLLRDPELLRGFLSAYRGHLLRAPSFTYPSASLRFSGFVFSRSGWWRRRGLRLPDPGTATPPTAAATTPA